MISDTPVERDGECGWMTNCAGGCVMRDEWYVACGGLWSDPRVRVVICMARTPDAAELTEVTEVIELIEPTGVTELIEPTGVTELIEPTEGTKPTEPTEPTGFTDPREFTDPIEFMALGAPM